MIVAVTGLILILFVIGHLLGNRQIFLGPEWINGYEEHLRELGIFLWVIRGILLLVVLLHIYYTIRLAIENRRISMSSTRIARRRARPTRNSITSLTNAQGGRSALKRRAKPKINASLSFRTNLPIGRKGPSP